MPPKKYSRIGKPRYKGKSKGQKGPVTPSTGKKKQNIQDTNVNGISSSSHRSKSKSSSPATIFNQLLAQLSENVVVTNGLLNILPDLYKMNITVSDEVQSGDWLGTQRRKVVLHIADEGNILVEAYIFGQHVSIAGNNIRFVSIKNLR